MLQQAVVAGDESKVVRALTQAEAADLYTTIKSDEGNPLCLMCVAVVQGHDHLVPRLLAAGLTVEGATQCHSTPLIEAACKGHQLVVSKLLHEYKANIQGRRDDGEFCNIMEMFY